MNEADARVRALEFTVTLYGGTPNIKAAREIYNFIWLDQGGGKQKKAAKKEPRLLALGGRTKSEFKKVSAKKGNK